MQLRTPLLLPHLFTEERIVMRRAGLQVSLLCTTRAGMTPAITPAPVLSAIKIDSICGGDGNVPGILGRRIYIVRSDTPRLEIFIHRKNSISFHDWSPFPLSDWAEAERRAARPLAFPLQKLLDRLWRTASFFDNTTRRLSRFVY